MTISYFLGSFFVFHFVTFAMVKLTKRQTKSALLFANGEVSTNEISKIKHQQFDMIIAADGAVKNALNWGYYPDYIVGDLDSIPPDSETRLPKTRFIYRPDQELNDLEKSLIFCEEMELSEVTLLGISGKRLDHTLNNLSVLSRYDQKIGMTIYDVYGQIFLVRDEWIFSGFPKQLMSLIPMANVEGIITKGLAFSLNNEALIFGQREGLSNYIVSNPVSVSIKSGLLLIFVIN